MKKYTFLSFLLAFAAAAITSAQDLETILDKHFEAIGQENIENVNTMKATGKLVTMGMEGPFTMVYKRPDKVRMRIEIQGTEVIQGFDGEKAWMQNPMMGSTRPVVVSGAQADQIKESADMDGQLWNYKEKGHKLELAGSEAVDGEEAHVLKLTKENGSVDRYFINKESYLIDKVVSSANINGMDMEVTTRLSDYREVNGYKMPHKTEQSFGGQQGNTILFEKVEVNEPVEDELFAAPAS